MTLQKPTILPAKKGTSLPFDVADSECRFTRTRLGAKGGWKMHCGGTSMPFYPTNLARVTRTLPERSPDCSPKHSPTPVISDAMAEAVKAPGGARERAGNERASDPI